MPAAPPPGSRRGEDLPASPAINREQPDHTTARPQPGPGLPDLLRSTAPEWMVLALCGVLYSQAIGLTSTIGGPGPAFYPTVLIVLLAIAMLAVLVGKVRSYLRARADSVEWQPPKDPSDIDEENLVPRRVAIAIAMSGGYVLATIYVGWLIATVCFLVGFLYLCGKRKLLLTVPLACGIALVFCYVFVVIVYIPLPTGVGVFDELTFRLFELMGAY